MTEPTQDTPSPAIPQTLAWCSWHDGFDGTCRLVRIVEQGSGPGGGVFACTACRARHGLVPVADQP